MLPEPASLERPHGCQSPAVLSSAVPSGQSLLVNDIHSQLNPTRVSSIAKPTSLAELQAVIQTAAQAGLTCSIAGGRHAMGGQQFRTEQLLVDTSALTQILAFQPEQGLIEVMAGIHWPDLIAFLLAAQSGQPAPVGISQKQTGADRLSLGGALAANVHGRGLSLKPIIGDVAAFTLIDAEGQVHTCSRQENAELFRLAVGGYGLFGIIASITLRLAPRRKIKRLVELIEVPALMAAFEERINAGCLYGDFQFAIEREDSDFLQRGILACYQPVADDTPLVENQRELSEADWRQLCYLAHTDRRQAFARYAQHYLASAGQIYWSDTHQLSVYLDDYHRELDRLTGAAVPASEMITEVYVPRAALADFMSAVRADFRQHQVDLIYGTVRLIERDDESFLAWAKERYACLVFNLHVEHCPAGLAKAQQDFRRLIDRAIAVGGSFYLTYHRWATRRQVETCYPQFAEFLRLKLKYDPAERFQSDWYGHYRTLFADPLT